MAYGDFKDLTRRAASDKILCDKVFNIAKYPNADGYRRGLASMVYEFSDKKSALLADKTAFGGAIKNENILNKELAEELRKPIIKKFNKRKVQSRFIDNIWGVDLANMQLMSKLNKRIRFFCVLLIFSVNTHGLFL